MNMKDLRETEPYQRAQETSGIAITPTDEYGSGENVQYLFHISKKIYDYNRLEKGSVATLIMSIDGKELDKICTVDYQHDPQQEHNVNFIIDRDGYILAYPDLSYAGEQIQKQESVEEFVQSTGRLEGRIFPITSTKTRNWDGSFTMYMTGPICWTKL